MQKGLTVVISPLQSLMKDQIDNLERINITDAVTVNGLLDPIERAVSLRRVENGEATILYISPESLRSKTIERLLLNRKIVRFVIDEAHCFSSWGQDFRVDYLYIADFIRNLCVQKKMDEMIPVSCFTATAKQNVIDDIRTYFKEKLNLDLILFTASAARKNLHYRVVEKSEDAKIEALRGLLDAKPCPAIVYVSRTKKASELADRLTRDGYPAKPYHGKMDKKEKSENQDSFLRGESRIMVATSAFGMGVDKKDIGLVIHYDISDSLENYVQEAGRAGRDHQITADCYVLFNDEDLNKHFLLLNQTRISQQEIQQVWKAIKDATRTRSHMSSSALEIAREAGWDKNVMDVETRVKTAIAALEEAGYVKRGQNMPRIYADGILARNAMEAIEKIRSSPLISAQEQERAIRIIKKLIASRSRQKAKDDAPQSRVDCIADDLGIEKHQVLHTIQLLREAKILADSKDLTGYLDETGSAVRSMHALDSFRVLEAFLLRKIPDEKTVVNIKELNECAETEGMKKVTPDRIQTVMNFWTVQGVIKREVSKHSQHLFRVTLQKKKELLAQEIEERGSLAGFILEYLEDRNAENARTIEFSILEIQEAYNQELMLGKKDVNTGEIEQALFYLSRIGAMKLDGGFLVTYNGLSIERLVLDNKTREGAKDMLKRQFIRSRHLPMCLQMIQEFETLNSKFKYKSDLLTFIHESQEEDFLMTGKGSIFVSTMHKAKGREFDHVVLMLNRFSIALEESKRLLYVAMTRARQSLTVHCNDDIFGNPRDSGYLHVEGLRYERDTNRYEASNRIIIQLTYKDVHLDYFFSTQHEIRTLFGGDSLVVDEQGCLVNRNQRILRFSKKFQDDISDWAKNGYHPCAAKVNHILYWKKEGEEQEILVLFPEVEFLRDVELTMNKNWNNW